ncbi:MAG: hypothetical protein HC941_21590 [Microcoleus sp. SU_5_3]|nr:hypothetical protein [Microcoleus sp. SU_5_3]
MRRYEQLSLLLGDLIATHHTNYNGDGKAGFGITLVLTHLTVFLAVAARLSLRSEFKDSDTPYGYCCMSFDN